MSWGMVAVAGATVVGGIMQKNSADDATEAAQWAQQQQIDFDRERYEEWQSIYGPIQENLAEYYSSITPEFYVAVGLEKFQQEQEKSVTAMNERLTQAGIDSRSGISQSLNAQSEIEAAEARATIRRDAPRAAAEDKSRFLQIGLGQNPGSSMANTLAQQSNMLTTIAQQQQQAAGQAAGAAVQSIGQAVGAYMNRPQTQTNQGGLQ